MTHEKTFSANQCEEAQCELCCVRFNRKLLILILDVIAAINKVDRLNEKKKKKKPWRTCPESYIKNPLKINDKVFFSQ